MITKRSEFDERFCSSSCCDKLDLTWGDKTPPWSAKNVFGPGRGGRLAAQAQRVKKTHNAAIPGRIREASIEDVGILFLDLFLAGQRQGRQRADGGVG